MRNAILPFFLSAAALLPGCATHGDGHAATTTSAPVTTNATTTVASPATRSAHADPVLTNIDDAWAMLANRPDWTALPALSVTRHPAEKFLAGLVIVVDPGHGKSDGQTDPRYKRGPAGMMEDHMNLRVSLLLRKLLVDAGATVVLTRETDALLSLADRAAIANAANGGKGADLFISVHHNASDNPTSNYTSIWYHGEVDWNGMELDVARSIAHAVGRHIRTQVAKTSPILSDQLMYASGFGLLRQTTVPSILCELSFFSDPAEEQRLTDATYNLREAYGIYEGLCEWAYNGRPTLRDAAVQPSGAADRAEVVLTATLDDGLPPWWGKDRNRIDTSSIALHLDGTRVNASYDPATRQLVASFDRSMLRGVKPAELSVRFRNMLGNSAWPTRYTVSEDSLAPLPPQRAGRNAGSLGPRPTSGPSTTAATTSPLVK